MKIYEWITKPTSHWLIRMDFVGTKPFTEPLANPDTKPNNQKLAYCNKYK
jgi:hypothetical protein